MNSTFTRVLPSDGWYYVQTHPGGNKDFFRVALWAENADGRWIGLTGIRTKTEPNFIPALQPIPYEHGTSGCYVHIDDLSKEEQAILNQRFA